MKKINLSILWKWNAFFAFFLGTNYLLIALKRGFYDLWFLIILQIILGLALFKKYIVAFWFLLVLSILRFGIQLYQLISKLISGDSSAILSINLYIFLIELILVILLRYKIQNGKNN